MCPVGGVRRCFPARSIEPSVRTILSTSVSYISQDVFKSFPCVGGGRKTVSRQHIFRVVFASIICEPDPVLVVLPDKRLPWQIDRQCCALRHCERARFRVAENDDRSRPHVQSGLFGSGGMI